MRGLHLGQQANSRQDARAIIQLYLCSDGERIDTGKRRYGFTLVVHYEISADAQFHVFEETVAEHGAAERHRVFAFGRGLIADALVPYDFVVWCYLGAPSIARSFGNHSGEFFLGEAVADE